jgi:uncharacterized protein YcgI (DUF1989 family)
MEMTTRTLIDEVMPPKTGKALMLKRGQRLRITDLEGKQVCDVAVFNAENPREKLSTSYSRTRYPMKHAGEYIPRDHLTEGDTLMSTLCRPLMTIVKETADIKGVHDTHHRMCNRYLYETNGYGPRDGCQEIMAGVMAPYGIASEDLPDTFDLNMNFVHDCAAGRWWIKEPVNKAGDYVELQAEMDVLVGLSNCPLDVMVPCNAFNCTPLRIEVFEA